MLLTGLLTAIIFLLILSVLVLIHEAGHYFVAKKFGIKVEEFGFGLPPRLWGKKKGETIYSLNWLPIGGFVKLYGEDEAGAGRIAPTKHEKEKKRDKDKDHSRAYYDRSIAQRAAVVIAGVVMNTLLAIVIFYAYMFVSGFKAELPLYGNHNFFLANQQKTTNVIISSVAKDSPAEAAGIKAFSKILSVNGQPITNPNEFANLIRENKGKEITILSEDVNSKERSEVKVTPRVNAPKNQGALGVVFLPMQMVTLSYDTPAQKVISGIVHPANLMAYNFTIMKSLVEVSVKEKTTEPISQGVSGPVGIFGLVGDIINNPNQTRVILDLLNLAGLLSISLAFFNILPIPGLDGGRLFFILIEAVIGRKVNQRVEGYAHAVGMLLLIGLIILITFKDIIQLFK